MSRVQCLKKRESIVNQGGRGSKLHTTLFSMFGRHWFLPIYYVWCRLNILLSLTKITKTFARYWFLPADDHGIDTKILKIQEIFRVPVLKTKNPLFYTYLALHVYIVCAVQQSMFYEFPFVKGHLTNMMNDFPLLFYELN